LAIAGTPDVATISDDDFRREQVGTEAYPYVWLQVRRSRQGFFSFAWRSLSQQVMGMVVPAAGERVLGSDQDAFTGRFEIEGERMKPSPICHTDHTTEKGFTTTGVISYGDGRIRQSIAVVALEDGETSLLVDRTVVDESVTLTLNEGFGVYVMNDFMNDNRVRISFKGGRRTVRGVGGKARVIETGSSWIKVAGCLGIETDDEQIYYEDAAERNTPERWKSLLQDRIYLRPTEWHPDTGHLSRRGIKFAFYLQPLDECSGALRLIPGSHKAPLHSDIRKISLRESNKGTIDAEGLAVEEMPAYVARSQPEDVIAFDNRIWHASWGGKPGRRMCSVGYFASPESPDEKEAIRQIAEDEAKLQQAFPLVRRPDSWAANEARCPVRAEWIAFLGSHGFQSIGPTEGDCR
jgi:hypothetical protein